MPAKQTTWADFIILWEEIPVFIKLSPKIKERKLPIYEASIVLTVKPDRHYKKTITRICHEHRSSKWNAVPHLLKKAEEHSNV